MWERLCAKARLDTGYEHELVVGGYIADGRGMDGWKDGLWVLWVLVGAWGGVFELEGCGCSRFKS